MLPLSIPAAPSAPKGGSGDERYKQRRGENPQAKQLSQAPTCTSNRPHHRAALPTLEFRAISPDLNLPKSTGQPGRPLKGRDTIAVSEATSGNLCSTYSSYAAAQVSKPTPEMLESAAGVSRMSSVSTEGSSMSVGTAFDYSFFPQNKYVVSQRHKAQTPRAQQSLKSNFNSENPQQRPEQKSTRRSKTRIVPPRGTSFAVARKSHRSNGRGPARRKSARNSHYAPPGKPRMIGNVANTPIFSTRARKIQVIRPSEKPAIIGIFSANSQVLRERVPTLQVSGVQGGFATKLPPQKIGVAKLITVPSNSTTSRPRELLVQRLRAPPSGIPDRTNIQRPGILPLLRFTSLLQYGVDRPAEPRAASSPPPVVKRSPIQALSPLREKKVMTNAEQRERGGIPEILRIGNKENSSLFQRLTNLDSLEVRSRY